MAITAELLLDQISSVSVPYSLNPDPGSLLNPDQYYDKICKKYIIGKFFLTKNRLISSTKDLRPLQTWNFFIVSFFGGYFWPAWTRIPNPDPLTQLNLGLNPDPKHRKLVHTFYQCGNRRFTHSDRNIALNGSQHSVYTVNNKRERKSKITRCGENSQGRVILDLISLYMRLALKLSSMPRT